MDPNVSEWLNLVFRWIHVLAGVMWIGHLWFFNFVNAQVAKTYDPDSRKKVVPELMPRALYWFRWGAAYTWVTGILLLWVVYWAGNAMGSERMSGYGSGGIALLIVLVAFAVYDVLWKNMKNETTGMIVSLALFAVLIFFMVSNHFPGVYGNDYAWVLAIVFVILGWGITKFLFNKAATPAPAQF